MATPCIHELVTIGVDFFFVDTPNICIGVGTLCVVCVCTEKIIVIQNRIN